MPMSRVNGRATQLSADSPTRRKAKKNGGEPFGSPPTSYSSSASIASAITFQHSAPIPEMRTSRSSSLRNGRASWMRYPSLCHWESPTIVALNNSSGTVTVWLAPQMTHSWLLVIVAGIASSPQLVSDQLLLLRRTLPRY